VDIQYAILGLLSWKPFSGYDLKKIIADSDLFYWSGNNNQIYYSLVHLHQQGWVSQEIEYQETLPAKKIYTITELGRAQLRNWSLIPPELPEFHNNFLIQLAWTDQLSGGELDDLLAKYEEEIEIQYKMRMAQVANPALSPDRIKREQIVWKAIFQNIQSAYRNELTWVRQLRSDLKDDPGPK
jgi:PadR family transcriptional regulator, regulatory protein AphA